MFENLVESGSHREDAKRKGSFLLLTLVVYLVLIAAGLIAGIVMAPAIIDQQTLELTALIAPVPVQQQQQQKEQNEQLRGFSECLGEEFDRLRGSRKKK